MESFLQQERKDKHGVHTYSLEEFGISPVNFDEKFITYMKFIDKLKVS